MKTHKTIVVGAGLAGVSAAHALQSRGREVLLIDAKAGPALWTSFANAGMLHPSMPEPWNGPGIAGHLLRSLFDPHAAMKLRLNALPSLMGWGLKFIKNSSPKLHWKAAEANYHLANYSVAHTRTLGEDLNLKYESSDNGIIKIFDDQAAMAGSMAMTKNLSALGLHFEILNAAEAVSLQPSLANIQSRIVGAIFMPNDSVGDAYKFTVGLFKDFTNKGGQSIFNCAVKKVMIRDGKCIGLSTDNGEFLSDNIVIAAGPRSSNLAKTANIKLHIRPAKGYTLTAKIDDPAKLPKRPVLDDAMHVAITPLGDTLRIGGTAEFAGFDFELTPSRIDNLRKILTQTYPALIPHLDMQNALPWCGFRPMSADGIPYIGSTSVDGLWVIAGHGQLGWSMASGSGEILADLMTHARPKINPDPYRVNR